ncbi:hypothetical protein [Halomonas borealis]|uniref:hypothetical protein n=1 Tax=Halomonas borealis TaxID=2508710 RepID=UPI001444BF96|nr:hypothetical protein [Halomonas borealis]
MRYGFINNFEQILAGAASDTAIEITLDGGGSQIGDAAVDLVYVLTLFRTDNNGNETDREVVHVTGVSGDTLTVARAQEGTTAQAWAAGDGVSHRLTAGVLSEGFLVPGDLDPYVLSNAKAVAIGDGASTFDPEWSNTVAVGREAEGSGSAGVVIGYNAYIDSSTSTSEEFKEYDFDGLVIIGSGAYAGGSNNVDGFNSYSVAVGYGTSSHDSNTVSMGYYAEAKFLRSVAIGAEAVGGAKSSVALGNKAESLAEGATATGSMAKAIADNAVAVGNTVAATETNCIAIGYQSQAGSYDPPAHSAPNAVCVGANSGAWGNHSVCVGSDAGVQLVFGGIAIGGWSSTDNYGGTAVGVDGHAYADYGTSLGYGAATSAKEGVALGVMAEANVEGGLQINALSYVPSEYASASVETSPSNPDGLDLSAANSTRQSASQVVIASAPIDLTTVSDTAVVDLPSGAMLFIDSVDVVIAGSDAAGGSPEIQVGTDSGTPADLLAATVVGKTAVGSRETHAPLISDGVTTVRAEVVTAGSGTAYQAKVVVRGYVMEL